MSTKSKNSKKTRCKLSSPMCNDRAEAFVGPQAAVRPRFCEVPSERDKRAFEMHAQGMTQRAIARELGCSQPTVHRGIKKYRFWFGSTLPEDRGEMTGFSRFRVALERHRLFLEHQQELSMQEWAQSRETTVESNTQKVYPEGRKSDGPKVEEVTTQKQRRRHGARVSHFNAATNLSRELLMLEAGHIGVHRMTCDLAMDPDERDRWGRERTTSEATIAQLTATITALTQKVAELEAKLASSGPSVFGMSESPLSSTPLPKSPDPLARQVGDVAPGAQPRGTGLFGGCALPSAQPLAPKTPDPGHESRTASQTPAVHRSSPASPVASPLKQAPCGNESDSRSPACADRESGESRKATADH